MCCYNLPLESSGRNELAKLRYNFSPQTSLTLTYLGGQLRGSNTFAQLWSLPNYLFEPPAGYTGSLAPGSDIPIDLEFPENYYSNANLYEGEFRTAVGPVTINARHYAAGVSTRSAACFTATSRVSPTTASSTAACRSATGYGANGLQWHPRPRFSILKRIFNEYTEDALSGYTVQATLPVANNVFSVSYDSVNTKSSASTIYSNPASDTVPAPPGTGPGVSGKPAAARGQFQLTTALQATLSDSR